VSDWTTPPIQVKPGLLAARTLLSHKQEHSAVAVMNISGVDQALRSGCAMVTATPCPSDFVHSFNGVVSINSVPMPEGVRDEAAELDAEFTSATDMSNYGNETVVKCASVHVARGGSPEAESPAVDDNAHVQPVIDKLPSSLTDDQQEQAIAVIKHNADIFGKHEFVVGLTDLVTARIVTGDHEPIAEPLRWHARAHLDVIDDTVERMMKQFRPYLLGRRFQIRTPHPSSRSHGPTPQLIPRRPTMLSRTDNVPDGSLWQWTHHTERLVRSAAATGVAPSVSTLMQMQKLSCYVSVSAVCVFPCVQLVDFPGQFSVA